MGQVGSWGDIAFDVYGLDDSEWFTFRDFSRETKARVVTHDVLDDKQKQQVTGRDLDQVKLTVQLDGNFCNVPDSIEWFREAVGEYEILIIGGTALGPYTLESVSEVRKHHDGAGRPIFAELALSLREYR